MFVKRTTLLQKSFAIIRVIYKRGFVRVRLRLSVYYHVFCHHAQRDYKKAIPKGSTLQWLDLKMAIFVKILRFKVMA